MKINQHRNSDIHFSLNYTEGNMLGLDYEQYQDLIDYVSFRRSLCVKYSSVGSEHASGS